MDSRRGINYDVLCFQLMVIGLYDLEFFLFSKSKSAFFMSTFCFCLLVIITE